MLSCRCKPQYSLKSSTVRTHHLILQISWLLETTLTCIDKMKYGITVTSIAAICYSQESALCCQSHVRVSCTICDTVHIGLDVDVTYCIHLHSIKTQCVQAQPHVWHSTHSCHCHQRSCQHTRLCHDRSVFWHSTRNMLLSYGNLNRQCAFLGRQMQSAIVCRLMLAMTRHSVHALQVVNERNMCWVAIRNF